MYQPTQQALTQIAGAFEYHRPEGNQAARYDLLMNATKQLAELIVLNTPASREQAVALTKLQETVMFAKASIAVNEVWDGPIMTAPMRYEIGDD